MKFTKEDACKELTAKLTPTVEKIEKWERTIKESVEHAMKLIGENSEMELAQFVELTLPMLETTKGFLNKESSDLTKGYKTKIEELEKKVKDQEGGSGDSGDEGGTNKTVADLLKRIESLEKINSDNAAQKSISEKKAAIKSKLKEKGVKREDWIDETLEMANIAETTDVEKVSETYLKMYNKFFANIDESDTSGSAGGGGDQSKRTKSVIEEAANIVKNQIV